MECLLCGKEAEKLNCGGVCEECCFDYECTKAENSCQPLQIEILKKMVEDLEGRLRANGSILCE